jgi:hypothetical protein
MTDLLVTDLLGGVKYNSAYLARNTLVRRPYGVPTLVDSYRNLRVRQYIKENDGFGILEWGYKAGNISADRLWVLENLDQIEYAFRLLEEGTDLFRSMMRKKFYYEAYQVSVRYEDLFNTWREFLSPEQLERLNYPGRARDEKIAYDHRLLHIGVYKESTYSENTGTYRKFKSRSMKRKFRSVMQAMEREAITNHDAEEAAQNAAAGGGGGGGGREALDLGAMKDALDEL